MLGELNELLKQIPIWRELVTLPARVRAIEERMGLAKGPLTDDRPTCRFCRTGKLDLVKSEPDPIFGDMGLKQDTLKCEACGQTEERQVDPAKHR